MSALLGSNEAEPYVSVNTLIGGYSEKSVAGGANVTLSDLEAQHAYHKFTGTLTANIDVIVPDDEKGYWVWNATSGAYTLTVKTASGTGVAVTQSKKVHLACDGTNVIAWTAEL